MVDIIDCRREGINIGYCPQVDALDDLLTGEEHLYFYARIRGISKRETDRVRSQLYQSLFRSDQGQFLIKVTYKSACFLLWWYLCEWLSNYLLKFQYLILVKVPVSCAQKFGISKIFFWKKLILLFSNDTIKLISAFMGLQEMYMAINAFLFKFLFINKSWKMYHDFHKHMNPHICFQYW